MFNPDKMKLKVNVGGVSKDIPQSELTRIVLGQDEKGEDILGDYHTYYNENMTVDMTKYEEGVKRTQREEAKASLESLQVKVNTVPFDADDKSQTFMVKVLALANFKFNQLLAQGATPAQAYEGVYKSTIEWRNADDKNSNPQIESIAKALEKGMLEVGNVYTN